MTKLEALDVVELLLAAFPTQRMRMSKTDTAGMFAAYASGLLDLEVNEARNAVNRVVKSAQWIPTIADIRAAVVEITQGARKNGGEAWGECCVLIRRYGSHRHPGIDFEISDPLIAKTVQALSWRDLCAGDNQAADRARFIELYDQLAKQQRTETAISAGANVIALEPGKRQKALADAESRRALPDTSAEERSQSLRDAIAQAGHMASFLEDAS